MTIPRPKILTALTVPTGGWTFKFYISVAAQYDTAKTVTIAAGDYFVAWDGQTDDLLRALSSAINTALATVGGSRFCMPYINSSNKVVIHWLGNDFTGATKRQIKVAWTESTAGLAAALGFDSSADDTSTADDIPSFTADWQHGYGWYADEDCYLQYLAVEDVNVATSPQAIGLSGVVKTQLMGTRYTNELSLQYVSRAKMYSRGIGYGTAPVYPYSRNYGLECWWQEARQGVRFRVYRDSRNDTSSAVAVGSVTADSTTTITDSSKSWTTDPEAYKGMLCYLPDRLTSGGAGVAGNQPGRFYITSHTATVLTSAAATVDNLEWTNNLTGVAFYIFDNRYQTYVLNASAMREFKPTELPAIDNYNLTIPLLRYVS
jgi:hypothetical protein